MCKQKEINKTVTSNRCDRFAYLCTQIHRCKPTTEKMEGLFVAAHGFLPQLGAAAIKHKFIGQPIKIQIFHTKNTPVYWGKIHPINQKCSLVQRKEFIGSKTHFQSYYHLFIGSAAPKEKSRNPLRPNQNWATFCPLSWSCNLSAIRAMNSELVGFPLVLDTV